ncbi:hypothetical protein SUDANB178_06784 [Streptomyces sp. enrichment culture]
MYGLPPDPQVTTRDRRLAVAAGAALLAGSAALRFGVFHAGVASAEDPAYTVVPRRERLETLASHP